MLSRDASVKELAERPRENPRKHDLPEDVVQEDQLELRGEVGINSILTHELVMFDVVLLFLFLNLNKPKEAPEQVWTNLKRGGIWYSNW